VLKDRVEFLGFRKDVPRILSAVDLLVAPTRYEAYGLGVHEALCCGIPAIVSATAGVAERYPDQLTMLLVGDPPSDLALIERLRAWRSRHDEQVAGVFALSQTLRTRTWKDMSAEIVRFALGSDP
jgi:glycosyltransferase involved in cell wall biosynthesis